MLSIPIFNQQGNRRRNYMHCGWWRTDRCYFLTPLSRQDRLRIIPSRHVLTSTSGLPLPVVNLQCFSPRWAITQACYHLDHDSFMISRTSLSLSDTKNPREKYFVMNPTPCLQWPPGPSWDGMRVE